jgi:adenosylmethionine-8-amino-7-oxononanoate aminotransferase
VAALIEQARRFCHVSLAGVTHEPVSALAEELALVTPPGLERVFFSDDGSTAIEAAVKMAAQFWQQSGAPKRTRFVALQGAFHGETTGAASLGGVEFFRRPFAGILFDCVHVEAPRDEASYARAFDEIATAIEREGDSLAAVVIEPLVQGADGMRMYPARLLADLRALCDRSGPLLIVDEVFTGYGRTGRFWACEHAGVSPDILCTAKGFSGGMMPMAATVVSTRVYDAFRGDRSRMFCYGHSFCGNPLGAAIAVEALRVMREEQVVQGVAPRSAKIAATVDRLSRLPNVAAPRTLGLIGAVDLVVGDAGYLGDAGWRVYAEGLRRGAYLRPLGNVSYVTPPLNIPMDDLDELLSIWEASVRAVVER